MLKYNNDLFWSVSRQLYTTAYLVPVYRLYTNIGPYSNSRESSRRGWPDGENT